MNAPSAAYVLKRLQTSEKLRPLSVDEIARGSGVHQSQVSRIMRGDFKRVSRNVQRICKFGGIDLQSASHASSPLNDSLRNLLDGSKSREAAVARVLDAVSALVRVTSANRPLERR